MLRFLPAEAVLLNDVGQPRLVGTAGRASAVLQGKAAGHSQEQRQVRRQDAFLHLVQNRGVLPRLQTLQDTVAVLTNSLQESRQDGLQPAGGWKPPC